MKSITTLTRYVLIVISFVAVSAQASETVWDFTQDGYNDPEFIKSGGYYGNTISTTQGDKQTRVDITAWSSTGDYGTVETANLGIGSSGLLTINRNKGDGHFIDNGGPDDFILLSFDKAVQLVGASFGLTFKDSDFSIAAFDTLPTFLGRSWKQIAGDAIFTSSFSQFSQGSHSFGDSVVDQNSAPVEARYWLIGAFHSAFTPLISENGSLFGGGNDGFKLAGITTAHITPGTSTSTVEVNEPANFALLLLASVLFIRRRQNLIP